jgi:hypothetical protein
MPAPNLRALRKLEDEGRLEILTRTEVESIERLTTPERESCACQVKFNVTATSTFTVKEAGSGDDSTSKEKTNSVSLGKIQYIV